MIHGFLAALFCTTALFVLAYDFWKKDSEGTPWFAIFYGIGMLGWASLGITLDSATLVTISVIQFCSSLFVLLNGKKQGAS